MTPAQLLAYLGPAVLYAGGATVVIFGLLRLMGRRLGGRQGLTLYLACFFLTLTQHPFPDPALLDCSAGGAQPILRPFATLDYLIPLWQQSVNNPGLGLSAWMGSKVFQAAMMNFFLLAGIGAAFARHAGGRRPGLQALGLAALLSGGAEISQFTGVFGLFPCAYRQFEVDDLIFNIGGFMTGFALMFPRQAGRHRATA